MLADFPYLIAYSVFLAVGCTIASERLGRRGMTRLARIGPLLGWSMFAAAAFDAIENFAMLRVIDGHTATWPGVALYAAIPKFAIAGLGLAYVIAGAVLGRGREGPKPAAGQGLSRSRRACGGPRSRCGARRSGSRRACAPARRAPRRRRPRSSRARPRSAA